MILDASFLIDLLAEDPGAIAKLEEMADRQLVVPTLAYTEVAIGIDAATPHAGRFDEIMDRVAMVPYGPEEARRAVDVQRDLRRDGARIGAVDVMIAGTAIARDEPIVTRNIEEFRRTPVRVSPY